MNKPKIIVILGQTSSGKSDLAVELAKKFNGEIISADSRQVYKGMDLGSGKITESEMKNISHHLLDVVSPKNKFSVADFQKKSYSAINDILKRGKLPIICGGTGFYIQSIVDGIVLPDFPKNPELTKKLESMELKDLQNKLRKLDSKRFKEIDTNNKIRLVRAIELATEFGKVPAIKKDPQYESLQIGIKLEQNKLEENIHIRLIKRLKKGMVAEIKKLKESGVSWKRLESFGLEYKYLALFAQNKILKEEMSREIETKSRQFAKRQMTWFKRDQRIKWFKGREVLNIEKEVERFLK